MKLLVCLSKLKNNELMISKRLGNVNGEMVWLKQPNVSEAWKETWTETVLSDGKGAPDTFLIPVTIGETDDRIQGLITAGFFSQSLDLWWRKDESRPWTKENVSVQFLH